MKKKNSSKQNPRAGDDTPREIPMTDLGWEADGTHPAEESVPRHQGDIHAVGTPGGGTASGGLAGTNIGSGDPDNADLEEAMGSGRDDDGLPREEAPYAGPSGGAVGGTPAQKRVSGGRQGGGIAPGGVHRGDSTIGSDPNPPQKK